MDIHSKEVHGKMGKKSPKVGKTKGVSGSTEIRKEFVDHLKVKKAEPTKKCKICLTKFYSIDEVKVSVCRFD